MKTKKLLVMSNFVEAYRKLVRNAYLSYVAFIEYDLSVGGNTKAQKDNYAMDALHYATKAMAMYECASYTNIKGLASNLFDIADYERKHRTNLDDNATMDSIQDWTWDYIEEQMIKF